MTELVLRGRDQPDIRARISIHDDECPNDIKELQLADQTQKALRSKHSWTPPDAIGSLHRAALRKARTLPYPYRPGHFSDIPASDALPCPIDRSNSLNSLSTIQRETEAASLSLYRGSPISAISPSYAAPSWTVNIDEELQDPCPPRPALRVETLSEQRKVQKRIKKNLKKQDKEQCKAQKAEEQLRRAFLAAEVTAARVKDAAVRGEAIPLRTKSTRSIASQLVKSLSLKSPLSKLSRHVRRDKSGPPTLDDFDSKSAIREYLNPSPVTIALAPGSAAIAELPAELPQYTPFEDLTRTQDNELPALLEDANPGREKDISNPFEDTTPDANPQPRARSMRCDSCQSPIRLNQVYYHCSICDNGDRMLCSSCDQAGLSCRHDLIEKVRNVSRPDSSDKLNVSDLIRQRSRTEAQQYAAAMWGLKAPDVSPQSARWPESPVEATISAASPWAYNDIGNQNRPNEDEQGTIRPPQKPFDDTRELDFRRREQDVVLREKEIVFRERETAMREQQASLKEQEATLHLKQQMFSLQLQTAITGQMDELSTGMGAQFQDLSQVSTYTKTTSSDCNIDSSAKGSITDGVLQNHNIRAHATKRKAGAGQATISPSNSTGSTQKPSPKRTPSGGRDPDDEEEDDVSGGTPKKIKQEPDALQNPEKLFACPFCKYDKSKYSEQNVQEKQYRGCSSGYWPDISRLKQHLYRVHWRRIHCTRCHARFDSKDRLDQHRRAAVSCMLVDCPCPEKFDEAQYNDIRRKRPTSTAEQVWYTIYSILFPGLPQPATPYADNVDKNAAVSPAPPETQDTMDVLGEVFESRLDQLVNLPGQGWLQSVEARQLIREQLRASMAEVVHRLRPANSPYLGNPSVEVSPISAGPPDSARRSSICLTTPSSSIPPSPVHGPGSANKNGLDSHFLLPGHRQSFSRPFSARTVPKLSTPQPPRKSQKAEAMPSVTFPVHMIVDPENDKYDEECDSWSHGDEHGLAITTDSIPEGFNFDFASAFHDLHKMEIDPEPAAVTKFVPVKLASLDDPSARKSAVPNDLKSKHSTTSSVDSGYGSLGHASSSASASTTFAPSTRQTSPKQSRKGGKNKGKQKRAPATKESSPVPESAINYEALEIPFQDFSGMNMDLNFDEHLDQYDGGFEARDEDLNVNMGAVNLSTYLDARYIRGVPGVG